MLALLQQYGPAALTAILGVCFAATFVPKDGFAKFLPAAGPSPDKAAGMILDAALLLAKAGRTDLAKEAFDLGAKCSRGAE